MSDFELETIAEVLDHQTEAFGTETFVACDDRSLSYQELRERSLRLAGGLARLGLQPGDRVAILSENSLEFIVSFFACARLGLVQVPLNVFLRGEFLRYQLEDSGSVAAIVDALGLEAIQALEPTIQLAHVIVAGEFAGGDGEGLSFGRVEESDPPTDLPALRSSDTAAIVYTSGTTGMPKGCVIPHGMFTQVYPIHQGAGYIVPGDRLLTPSPMFHMGFLAGMLATSLCSGASIWCTRKFSASTFLQTAREIRATVIYAVGSVGMLILAQAPSPEDRKPSNLRVALLTPMPAQSQLDFEKRFGVPVVAENYGQSECIVIGIGGIDQPRQRGSAGQPASFVDVAIVDEHDHPVTRGEVGEIVVRPRQSDMMFKGYWNDPEATLEAWRNLWHHTGDLARQSADGTLWIIDRKKDSIRRRGENVSSIELEGAIGRHPEVQAVAVHAVASEWGDDEIKACIVARNELDPAEMFAFFKRELPYFAVPRYVELMEALPVNAVGRVRKQTLRERGLTSETWDFEALGMTVSRDERRGRGFSDPALTE